MKKAFLTAVLMSGISLANSVFADQPSEICPTSQALQDTIKNIYSPYAVKVLKDMGEKGGIYSITYWFEDSHTGKKYTLSWDVIVPANIIQINQGKGTILAMDLFNSHLQNKPLTDLKFDNLLYLDTDLDIKICEYTYTPEKNEVEAGVSRIIQVRPL